MARLVPENATWPDLGATWGNVAGGGLPEEDRERGVWWSAAPWAAPTNWRSPCLLRPENAPWANCARMSGGVPVWLGTLTGSAVNR